jgi:hypothetical protein
VNDPAEDYLKHGRSTLLGQSGELYPRGDSFLFLSNDKKMDKNPKYIESILSSKPLIHHLEEFTNEKQNSYSSIGSILDYRHSEDEANERFPKNSLSSIENITHARMDNPIGRLENYNMHSIYDTAVKKEPVIPIFNSNYNSFENDMVKKKSQHRNSDPYLSRSHEIMLQDNRSHELMHSERQDIKLSGGIKMDMSAELKGYSPETPTKNKTKEYSSEPSSRKNSDKSVSLWCHQCKKKHVDIIYCSKYNLGSCSKKYCKLCIERHYNETFDTIDKERWICLFCRNICACALCRRNRGENVPKKSV